MTCPNCYHENIISNKVSYEWIWYYFTPLKIWSTPSTMRVVQHLSIYFKGFAFNLLPRVQNTLQWSPTRPLLIIAVLSFIELGYVVYQHVSENSIGWNSCFTYQKYSSIFFIFFFFFWIKCDHGFILASNET
jgi:hypothetical protein